MFLFFLEIKPPPLEDGARLKAQTSAARTRKMTKATATNQRPAGMMEPERSDSMLVTKGPTKVPLCVFKHHNGTSLGDETA